MRRSNKAALLAAVAGVGLWAGTAQAAFMAANAVPQNSVTASASSVYVSGSTPYPAQLIVDWSGMTGVYPDGTDTGYASVVFWQSATSTAPADQWLSFDFGSVLTLDGMHYWNANQNSTRNSRGIRQMDIQTSADGSTWTDAFTDVVLTKAPGGVAYAGNDYDWTGTVSTRYMRFNVDSNWGDANYVAFSEVVFYKPIPEPATIAGVLCLGLPAILRRRRR